MKILCLGDTHVGAGTSHRQDALADQAAILDQIVDVAVAREADLVLHSGDVFHRTDPTPRQLHVWRSFANALAAREIPMIAIHGNGNHEAATDQPSAIGLFDSRWLRVSRAPEYITEFAGVAVCTLPAVSMSRLRARLGGGDPAEVHELAVAMLLETARDLHTAAPDDRPRILLAHWPVSGSSLPSGLPVADLHDPVLPLDALEEIGYDAIVLGHIHKAQPLGTLAPDDELMPIFYTGSPGCWDFGEANVNHGVWLLTIGEGLSYPTIEFVPLVDRRFVTVDVDLTATGTDSVHENIHETIQDSSDGRADSQSAERGLARLHADGASDAQAPGMGARTPEPPLDETDRVAAEIAAVLPLTDAVVRVRVRASEEQWRRVDVGALEGFVLEAGAHRLHGGIHWEPVRASRARVEGVTEDLDPLAAVAAWTVANEVDDAPSRALYGLAADWLVAA